MFQATARAAAGSLAPAHGSGGSGGGGGVTAPVGTVPLDQEDGGEEGARTAAASAAAGPELTGYVKSVRDDLTAFVSSDRESAAAAEAAGGGGGAIGQTLGILGRLGEDLGRMVRLRGRVEHQVKMGLIGWVSVGEGWMIEATHHL